MKFHPYLGGEPKSLWLPPIFIIINPLTIWQIYNNIY